MPQSCMNEFASKETLPHSLVIADELVPILRICNHQDDIGRLVHISGVPA